MSASAREDNQGEESDILSPRGRKRTTSEDPETKVSKWEKKSSLEGPASEGILAAQCPRGDQPSNEPQVIKKYLIVKISYLTSEENNRSVYLAVRILALLSRARLRGIFFWR